MIWTIVWLHTQIVACCCLMTQHVVLGSSFLVNRHHGDAFGFAGIVTSMRPTRSGIRTSFTFRPLAAGSQSQTSGSSGGGYQPIYENIEPAKNSTLYPKAGDIVRYTDIDGGKEDGEVLVGKIAYIQQVLGVSASDAKTIGGTTAEWMVEITQLEDVGNGYYAEFSSRQRNSKKTMRSLRKVSPIAASYVRSESAFKVPRDKKGVPLARAEYDVETYKGPFFGENAVNQDVVDADWEVYDKLKGKLLQQAAIVGVVGTLIAELVKGPEDAAVYAAGALAGFVYLLFLSIKTDTIGSDKAKLGSGISNFRFVTPFVVFIGVAIYNKSTDNPLTSADNIFSTVTPEQFGAAIIGFLTYRIPLFANQISDLLKEEGIGLPGSAGMVLQLAKKDVDEQLSMSISSTDVKVKTVLVISGPRAAGRNELVERLIAESEGRFVTPQTIDRIEEAAKFERLETRDELLFLDPSGRYGVTKEGILNGAPNDGSVVVINADVETVKKVRKVPGTRLIGVWVGLDATDKFEARLKAQLESGELVVPEDDNEASFLRAKVKEIVKDIEYGIVSGVFEFTILNDEVEESMKQLREAAEYCFK